jgi:hypothetical protein
MDKRIHNQYGWEDFNPGIPERSTRVAVILDIVMLLVAILLIVSQL